MGILRKVPQHEVYANKCPRCGSSRIYADENEFVCLSCSFVAIIE